MPDAVQIFIAPPSDDALRTRLVGRGTDDAEQVPRAPRHGTRGAAARRTTSPHVVVNDRLDDAVAALGALLRELRTLTQPTLGRKPDLTPRRPPARARRLALRQRHRRRQARAADQLLLPQPRRGHVRGVPAADGRHGVEELPHDRARGSRPGQDQLPLPARPAAAPWRASSSASRGGIAAYKALELTRLAIKAGHARARDPDRGPAALRRRGELRGITGAPVLIDEFERDPLRGAFPGDPLPRTRRSRTSRWSSAPTPS